MIACPVCHHRDLEGELFCTECGAWLVTGADDVHSTDAFIDTGRVRAGNPGGAAASGLRPGQIALRIEGTADPVILDGRPNYVLGRDGSAAVALQLNLAHHSAEEKGVSRVHAALRRDGERWLLIDLGSTNGTRLNGSRLAPQQPAPLSNGDEIYLGRLGMRIHFG